MDTMTEATRPKPRLFRYAGHTLDEWLPAIVARVTECFDPERIVLFGSLARGNAGPDSDIDLLVVFRDVVQRRSTAVALRLAIVDIPAPVDFVVTDLEEIERRGHIAGSALGAALREGKVVYRRAA
jgi:predicted nucleotidyltransferase